MQVEFVRFKAADSVELQGWYSNAPGDEVVIHLHGKSGNGYENDFLDTLRQANLGIVDPLFAFGSLDFFSGVHGYTVSDYAGDVALLRRPRMVLTITTLALKI